MEEKNMKKTSKRFLNNQKYKKNAGFKNPNAKIFLFGLIMVFVLIIVGSVEVRGQDCHATVIKPSTSLTSPDSGISAIPSAEIPSEPPASSGENQEEDLHIAKPDVEADKSGLNTDRVIKKGESIPLGYKDAGPLKSSDLGNPEILNQAIDKTGKTTTTSQVKDIYEKANEEQKKQILEKKYDNIKFSGDSKFQGWNFDNGKISFKSTIRQFNLAGMNSNFPSELGYRIKLDANGFVSIIDGGGNVISTNMPQPLRTFAPGAAAGKDCGAAESAAAGASGGAAAGAGGLTATLEIAQKALGLLQLIPKDALTPTSQRGPPLTAFDSSTGEYKTAPDGTQITTNGNAITIPLGGNSVGIASKGTMPAKVVVNGKTYKSVGDGTVYVAFDSANQIGAVADVSADTILTNNLAAGNPLASAETRAEVEAGTIASFTGKAISQTGSEQSIILEKYDAEINGQKIIFYPFKPFDEISAGGSSLSLVNGKKIFEFNGQKTYLNRIPYDDSYYINKVSNKKDDKYYFRVLQKRVNGNYVISNDKRFTSGDEIIEHPTIKGLYIAKEREAMWKKAAGIRQVNY